MTHSRIVSRRWSRMHVSTMSTSPKSARWGWSRRASAEEIARQKQRFSALTMLQQPVPIFDRSRQLTLHVRQSSMYLRFGTHMIEGSP
jgi:hypothetical protein